MQPFYQDMLTTLYHGDCLEMMAELPAQSFDAIICDPPYGTTACAWDTAIPFKPMWEAIKRLARPRAAVVLFGSQPFTSALVMSNPKGFKYELVWDKERGYDPQLANVRPMKAHENIAVFSADESGIAYYPQMEERITPIRKTFTKRLQIRKDGTGHPLFASMPPDEKTYTHKFPTSVLVFGNHDQANKYHPSEKPLALLEYLVRTYTNEGDRVLDFAMGSGTTVRACKNLRRHSVGIELLEEYCAVAARRLNPTFEAAITDPGTSLEDLPMFAT